MREVLNPVDDINSIAYIRVSCDDSISTDPDKGPDMKFKCLYGGFGKCKRESIFNPSGWETELIWQLLRILVHDMGRPIYPDTVEVLECVTEHLNKHKGGPLDDVYTPAIDTDIISHAKVTCEVFYSKNDGSSCPYGRYERQALYDGYAWETELLWQLLRILVNAMDRPIADVINSLNVVTDALRTEVCKPKDNSSLAEKFEKAAEALRGIRDDSRQNSRNKA